MTVAVVGSYGLGLSFSLGEAPGPGETVLARSMRRDFGGKGSNQAIGLARLGIPTDLVTAIGEDSEGDRACELWEREGVRAHVARVPGQPTMTGAIIVEDSGENRIIVNSGALDFLDSAAVERHRGVIESASILLTQFETSLDGVETALRIARESGVRTVLNPAPARPAAEARALIGLADIITPNLGEALALLGETGLDAAAAAEALSSATGAVVVLTAGADGAYLADGGQVAHIPGVRVSNVVDTTGAGDAFNAALIASLVRGEDLRSACRIACALAARSVQIAGVVDALPVLQEGEEI